MYIQNADRKQLLGVLAGDDVNSSINIASSNEFPNYPPLQDEMYLVWENDPRKVNGLPAIIIIHDDMVRDFFAWTSTYISTLRPFSAYVRVIPFTLLANFKNIPSKPWLARFDEICAAVIISEAISISPERTSGHMLSPLLCASTLSHLMTRALALDTQFKHFEYIAEKLINTRNLTFQPQRKLDIGEVMAVWYVIYNLKSTEAINSNYYKTNYSSNKLHISFKTTWKDAILSAYNNNKKQDKLLEYYLESILSACREYADSSDISNRTLLQLTNYDNAFVSIRDEMQDSREKRVLCFNRVLNSDFFNSQEAPIIKSFLCGYLASRISPGSLLHSDLIWPHVNKLPTALLWYGLFAGLTPKNDVLTSFEGLGRRLIRDLLESSNLFDQPRSDISAEELEVYFGVNNIVPNFRRGYTNHISVELAPCITTVIRWPESDRGGLQPNQDSPKQNTPSELIAELGVCVKKIEDIHRQLAKVEQGTLQKVYPKKNYPKKTNKSQSWKISDKDDQGKLI